MATRWKMTPMLALIAPLCHSLLYGNVLVHMIRNPTSGVSVDFTTLEGIMSTFALKDGAFASWLHYCAFDPLVGLGIVLDAKRNAVPHLLCVPCLVATALAGPLGFAAYLLLRTLVLAMRRSVSRPPPTGFAWGKTY